MAVFSKNIGPCDPVYDGTSLGLTHGGISLVVEDLMAETKADVTGESPRGVYTTGRRVIVRSAVTEATIEQIAKLLNGTVTGTTTKGLVIKSQVGVDKVALAKELILKPIVDSVVSTTEADWIYILAAIINSNFDVPIQVANQRVWAFQAVGVPVNATMIASGGHLYNSGAPQYAVGDLIRFGKATT